MTLEVIGAGFGRTGTLSLKFALEKLGFDKCYHMMELSEHPQHADVWAKADAGESIDWDSLFAGYKAAVDWPSCNFWRQQMAHFPEAKVLLSLRDPDGWYESVMNTIYPSTLKAMESDDPTGQAFGKWANAIIWERVFEGRMEDKAHAIEVFNRHNETVKSEVPPERLLVFEAKEGWEPLCAFLGVPVPDEDYPRSNTTEDFKKNRGLPDS